MIDKDSYQIMRVGSEFSCSAKNNSDDIQTVHLMEWAKENSLLVDVCHLSKNVRNQKDLLLYSLSERPLEFTKIGVRVVSENPISFDNIPFELVFSQYLNQRHSLTASFLKQEDGTFIFDADEHHIKFSDDTHHVHTEDKWRIKPKSMKLFNTFDLIFDIPPKTTFEFHFTSYLWEKKSRPYKTIFAGEINLKKDVPYCIDLTKPSIDYDMLDIEELNNILLNCLEQSDYEKCDKIQIAINKKKNGKAN